jgi:peptidoglycan/xylan/chitin deacetylase (PgdA/CDA1 family)
MRINFLKLFLLLFFFPTNQLGNAREFISENKPGQINCFVYHRFGDNRYPSTNISVEDFRQHLEFLKQNDYKVLTLGKALELLENDSVPEKTVVLTVDDGYKSFFDNAMPLLKEFDYPATLFINTRQFGSGDFLSVQQILQLREEGIEIGNHSHSHAHFVNLGPEARVDSFRNDIQISQKNFKEKLGFQPELFAFPYGEFTPGMQEILKEFGFKGATAQKSGVIASFSDRFALPRFPMAGPFVKIESFKQKAQMKALSVKPVNAESPLIANENPPQLKLKLIQPEQINMNQIQFFADGKKQNNIEIDRENNIITIQAGFPLKPRRTLYTVTAPSKTSPVRWHWYSFLWINNSVEE